jgi:hypothetical protein
MGRQRVRQPPRRDRHLRVVGIGLDPDGYRIELIGRAA